MANKNEIIREAANDIFTTVDRSVATPLDADALVKELGDCLWYIAAFATVQGLSLDDIAQRNIDKLRRRYPEGFDPERSRNRTE